MKDDENMIFYIKQSWNQEFIQLLSMTYFSFFPVDVKK